MAGDRGGGQKGPYPWARRVEENVCIGPCCPDGSRAQHCKYLFVESLTMSVFPGVGHF